MPELPEVNTVMKIFRNQVIGKKISAVEIFDDYILKNISANDFEQRLTNNRFTDTYRQGKYFFGELVSGESILFHLGMTGDMIYYSIPEDAPRHERFRIDLEDGMSLGYNDPRKFSDIRMLPDRNVYLKEIGLGPDALSITKSRFLKLISSRKGILKAFLLNQKIIAGIGNLYADEICFQCNIHPGSSLENLSENEWVRIYTQMKKILKLAVKKNAYYKVYPDDWFWKWRTEGSFGLDERWTVRKDSIAGRTTYWVEGKQVMY